MKIKSLNNQSDTIGSTIVYTLLLLLCFGGIAYSLDSLLWLIPFLIGFKILLFLMLRNLKGVIFYTDKLEIGKYGLSDQRKVIPINQVVIRKIQGGSIRLPENAINVFIDGKKLAFFRLDDEREFEIFKQKTSEAGYIWK